MRRSSKLLLGLLVVLVVAGALAFYALPGRRSGHVRDEAIRAGRSAASFPAASEDYFKDMDNGVHLTEDQIKGRDMWLVWTGGNDRLWDELTRLTFGSFDLLKILS